MTPRLLTLKEAKAYLGGRHPQLLHVQPALRGVYDIRAIDAALDRLAGLTPVAPVTGAANDQTDELVELQRRVEAHASRRA
jgi:hypothetical protein